MCTLIAAVRTSSSFPLLVAANRDEQLDRPARGPFVWREGFLAPRDEEASGTWLGLTRTGLFVAVTNRFGVEKLPGRRSRGLLVVDALQASSAPALHERLKTLSPDVYNAFHLFYADAQNAFVTWSDGRRVQQEELSSGLHVITERSLGGDDHARSERARAAFPAEPMPTLGRLAEVLALHAPDDPLGSLCVHAPAFNYGTRSSFVLKLGADLRSSELASSDRRPCEEPPAARPELLRALGAAG